jgi:hydroxymethylglutaryl-CoA reductase
MNGIDACAIALGQDWRAIEAGCHAFAHLKTGSYQPLSSYEIVSKGNEKFFKGELEIPIAVGSKGGVLGTNPIYE